jgi:hypothetical protein
MGLILGLWGIASVVAQSLGDSIPTVLNLLLWAIAASWFVIKDYERQGEELERRLFEHNRYRGEELELRKGVHYTIAPVLPLGLEFSKKTPKFKVLQKLKTPLGETE